MKKIILAILPLSLIFTSCSDKLSNSKAKKIAKECLEAEGLAKESANFFSGKKIRLDNDSLIFQKLEKEGYLTLEKLPKENKWQNYELFNITLTEKSKPFIEKSEPTVWGKDATQFTVKTNDLELEKVSEVTEIPAFNAAEVVLNFKKTKKTPFYEFSRDKTDFLVKKVSFSKTSEGWRWCEN